LTLRPSHSALNAVGRALEAGRDELVTQWSGWIRHRTAEARPDDALPILERQLGLLVDILIRMTGPVRRQAAQLWFDACEYYGRAAATRGLAAGEVVEELQHLRELLIRHLSDIIAALPARYSLATVLRLNRQVDHGIARAVVGYTDALVETLFNQNGVPVYVPDQVDGEAAKQLQRLEAELARVRASQEASRE
jgi:hypothetical protein